MISFRLNQNIFSIYNYGTNPLEKKINDSKKKGSGQFFLLENTQETIQQRASVFSAVSNNNIQDKKSMGKKSLCKQEHCHVQNFKTSWRPLLRTFKNQVFL